MARMWPVDGAIGENGGPFTQQHADGHQVRRWFWHAEEKRAEVSAELARIGQDVRRGANGDLAHPPDEPGLQPAR